MQHPQVPEISVLELKEMLDNGEKPYLLDVRRPDEYDIANLNGELITLDTLPDHLDDLEAHKDELMIVYCRSGARSARAVQFLQTYGFDKAKNLKGGILAWSREIDPSMPQY